jgi:glycosyltransferase involved in cell wall biosynthesis
MTESPLSGPTSPPGPTCPPGPMVSIVLGTYNGAAYLQEQLDSIFAQTYPYIEVVAVDDGSQDDTVLILRANAARHPNMKVYVNEHNLGFIRNFEKGCSISTGALIAVCDQDDYWLADKVAKMVAAIGDYPMIYCDSKLCDQRLQYLGRNISDIVHNETFYDPRQLCVFSRMYGHTTLVKREHFLFSCPFNPTIPHDGWMAYHATLRGGVKYLPEGLVLYRQHAANVFGVVGGKRKRRQSEDRAGRKQRERENARTRMKAYYDACPESLRVQKKMLAALLQSYESFSLTNNCRRMFLFFANYRLLLVVKKYGTWRKLFFCLKMFGKMP